jgi:hypothetical protein
MKKLLYIIALFFVTSMAITACTEDQDIKPSKDNGGGGGSDPIK